MESAVTVVEEGGFTAAAGRCNIDFYAVWRPDPIPVARAFVALLRIQAAQRAPSARVAR
ncbi:hypothetical protein OZ429_02770 [Xanthomonas fragariae]|nr:hypothetical protein [Xanthomonas fragariae]WAT15415.1 hypothetical protein OZ429_02770 [Xanthomonas fragariae]